MALLHECQTASELREHYKAVRQRVRAWKSPEPPAKPEPVVVEIIQSEPIEEVIEVVMATHPEDIHVENSGIDYSIQPEPEPPYYPTIAAITQAVCNKYRVAKIDVISHRRTAAIVRPRQIAMALARGLTLHTMPSIGLHFGGRDHTTVLHAIRKIAGLRAGDPALDAELMELEQEIMKRP